MKTLRTLSAKPEQVKDGWRVYNAPRPIVGTETFTGPFLHGIFYAMIGPEESNIEMFHHQNDRLHACTVEYVTKEEAVAEERARLSSAYSDVDLSDVTDEDLIDSWVAEQNSRLNDSKSPQTIYPTRT